MVDFKEDFISSWLFNERSYYIFLTIAVISVAICAFVCISSFSFHTSVKIFRAPATTLADDVCYEVNLTLRFLWLEDIILQSSELSNEIDKGLLLGRKKKFYIASEVVWEIREAKLLQMMSAIFSCKGGPISRWLSVLWTLSKFKLCTLCDSVKLWIIVNCFWYIRIENLLTWPYLFCLPGHYSHLDVSFLLYLLLSLGIGIIPSLGTYAVPSLGICFLSLEI